MAFKLINIKIIFSHKVSPQANFTTIKSSFIDPSTNTEIPSIKESPKLNKDNPKEILIKIVPNIEEVNKATVQVVFEDPASIKSDENPLIFLKQKEFTISPVSYYKPPSEATVANTAKGAGSITKAIMVASLVFSVSTALALIKIQQMLDFLLLLNVSHPSNVRSFLQILSQSVFEDLPNGLHFLTDDSCNIQMQKFIEEEVSCQIFENLGNFIVLVILFVLAKIVFYLLHHLTKDKKGKVSEFIKKRNEDMGLMFWIDLMEGIQLDVFMTFFLGVMKSGSEESKVSEFNFLTVTLLAFVALFVNLSISFLTHRAFQATSKDKNKTDKFIKANYKKYEYLIEDFRGETFFQKFFRPLNNAKDLLISFSLVVLHDIPILQIGTIALWLLAMLVGTLTEKPYKEMKENITEGLRGAIYFGCCLVMMLQSAIQNSWTRKAQYQFVGYPMIAMIGVLIVFNIGISVYENYCSIKEFASKIKNSLCKGSESKGRNKVSDMSSSTIDENSGSMDGDSKMINLNQESRIGDSKIGDNMGVGNPIEPIQPREERQSRKKRKTTKPRPLDAQPQKASLHKNSRKRKGGKVFEKIEKETLRAKDLVTVVSLTGNESRKGFQF